MTAQLTRYHVQKEKANVEKVLLIEIQNTKIGFYL